MAGEIHHHLWFWLIVIGLILVIIGLIILIGQRTAQWYTWGLLIIGGFFLLVGIIWGINWEGEERTPPGYVEVPEGRQFIDSRGNKIYIDGTSFSDDVELALPNPAPGQTVIVSSAPRSPMSVAPLVVPITSYKKGCGPPSVIMRPLPIAPPVMPPPASVVMRPLPIALSTTTPASVLVTRPVATLIPVRPSVPLAVQKPMVIVPPHVPILRPGATVTTTTPSGSLLPVPSTSTLASISPISPKFALSGETLTGLSAIGPASAVRS